MGRPAAGLVLHLPVLSLYHSAHLTDLGDKALAGRDAFNWNAHMKVSPLPPANS
jgi:hypothetical protein